MNQYRPCRIRRSRTAFTLIELLTVMLIIGLISATVAFRMTGLTSRARFEWGISQIVTLDAAARSFARNHGRTTSLEFELGSGRLTRANGKSKSDFKSESLGANFVVRRFVSHSRDTTTGRASVDYSTEGTSGTYAVEINYGGQSKKPVWLVFVGATGHVKRMEEESETIRLVKTVATPGNDAR